MTVNINLRGLTVTLRLIAGVLLFPAAQGSEPMSVLPVAAQTAPSLGLDHVVIAVNDLERAAESYRALGFALKPGRPHANGIRNYHAKFPDGTELELLTAPAARDDLTAKYVRHLHDGDGPAYLALFPGRDTPRPDTRMPPYIFWGGLNHSPTDRPEHFAHHNTADSLIGVWVADLQLGPALAQAQGVFADASHNRQAISLGWQASKFPLERGEVYLLSPDRRLRQDRPIVGVVLRVKDMASAEGALGKSGVAVQRRIDRDGRTHLLIPPEAAHGLWLDFTDASGRS